MEKKKGWIALLVCLLFFTTNVAWAGMTFKAPFTSDATELKSGVAATVDGPDGWYTWVDTDGVLQGTSAQASPSARIETDGLLVEGMGVNLCLQSNAFTTTWGETGNINTVQNQTGPDGVASSAWVCVAMTAGAGSNNIHIEDITSTTAGTYTYSVFVNKNSGCAWSMMVYDSSNTAWRGNVDFQWTSDVLSVKSNDVGTGSVKQLANTDWWRASVSCPGVLADAAHTLYLTPTEYTVAGTGSQVFYGAQFESTPYLTSYIPTTTASAVRWSQEGAIDTTDILGSTNTTGFKLSAASGNSFFQSDDITITDYAGVLDSELNTENNATEIGVDTAATTGFTNSGCATFESSTTQAYSGSNAIHAVANSDGDYITESWTVTSGAKYLVQFNYIVISGDAGSALDIELGTSAGNSSYLSDTANTESSWTRITKVLTTTSTALHLTLTESGGDNDAEFYIDNLSVKKITTSAPAYRITLTDDSSETLVGYIGYADSAYENNIRLNKDADVDQDVTITLSLPDTYECVINWGDGNTDTVTGPQVTTAYDNSYGDANAYSILITGDINRLTYFGCADEPISGDIATFKNATSLTFLSLCNTSVEGDIANLSGLTSLITLYLYNTSVEGDIAALKNATSLATLHLYSTSVEGDIANLSGLTSLTALGLNDTSIEGDIANLSGLTSLTFLNSHNTSVEGDIGDLATLTSLTSLSLYNTSVEGDIADLATLTALTSLYLLSTSVDTYTQGVLPDWDACNIYIQNLGLSETEVDDFLADLDTASTASVKALNISGTNSAPSAAGLVSEGNLETKGWTVTVTGE